MIQELLERFGIKKYEDLRPDEIPVFDRWLTALQSAEKGITIADVKVYIAEMRDIVEAKLVITSIDKKEDQQLKARLENYRLLEAFLISPEKAKQSINKQIDAITSGRK